MNTFTIKQGDTLPAYRAVIVAPDANGDDQPVPLPPGSTVRFHLATRAPIDAAMFIENGPGGQVRYDWFDGDTDVVGKYRAEIEVTFPTGQIETFPNSGDDHVQVVREVA